jgi:putative flippase GtrA
MNILGFRFAAFSVVGLVGFVVQLGALWLLTRAVGLHYLPATVMATELAILLNFAGHEAFTWSDRRGGVRQVIWRLCRFHGANGAISLTGGAVIMPFLIEAIGIHYLVANVMTVGLCAAANFVAADRIVFTPAVGLAFALVAAGAPVGGHTVVAAAELRAGTLDAFTRYVRLTETRMEAEVAGRAPLLWIDRLKGVDRQQAEARLKRGETVVARLETRDGGREIDVPDGLIHHWVGTTFIRDATVDDVIALMQDYERYSTIYAPNVRRSRTIRRDGDRFAVHLQFFMKKVISVVLNTENDVRYQRIGQLRAHVRSYSTRIAEVQNAGDATEVEAPVGRDSGYLWRFFNYCSIEQRSPGLPASGAETMQGTYVQCESISLSRGVPLGLGWLVGPFVTSIPRESLEFTLSHMRAALISGR